MFTAERSNRLRRDAGGSLDEPTNSRAPAPPPPARPNRIYSARPWTAGGRSPLDPRGDATADKEPASLPSEIRLPGDARGSTTSIVDIPEEIIIDPTKIGDSATRHLMDSPQLPSTSKSPPMQNTPNAKPRLRKMFTRQRQQHSIETIRTIDTPPPTKEVVQIDQIPTLPSQVVDGPVPKEEDRPEIVAKATTPEMAVDEPVPTENQMPKPIENGGHVVLTAEDLKPDANNNVSTQEPGTKFMRVVYRIFRLRGNRVADASGGNDTVQNEFLTKFGLGERIISEAETEEWRKGRLKYVWNKLVIDTNQNYFYTWLAIISAAYVYNLIVIAPRTVFCDLSISYLLYLWVALDIFVDIVYLMDMFIRARTGFLEQGLLVRDIKKIKNLYFRSRQFKLDIISMIPLDYIIGPFVYHRRCFDADAILPGWALLRVNRLLRFGRLQRFMEQTATRSSLPNAFRVGALVWYITVIIHWNACLYFYISCLIGLDSDSWAYGRLNTQSLPSQIDDTLVRRYIYSFYWSTLILTTIGEVPYPQRNMECLFVTIDLMCGVLIFATIVGNVGSMISNMNAARTEFQNRMDGIKQYMELRKVSKQLEIRVIKWFDYLWSNKQSLSDQQVLKVLPDKLQAEIAMHVHFVTLRKDCEAGLLAELVLKLQLQVFSPGDYICRKGDIGREMYIVKRGKLQVVGDDGTKIYATLIEGAVFGELSILNIAGSKNGNRRTANVRSVGYTDLFVLNKNDLWNALKEYPDARKMLIQKGREILKKDNLLDENAPEENRTPEEIAEELQSSVRILQTRIARLIAERVNTDTKLNERIRYLEDKLSKYEALLGPIEDQHEESLSQQLIIEDARQRFDNRPGPSSRL